MAIAAIGKVGNERAVATLADLTEDARPRIRGAALSALADAGGGTAEDILLRPANAYVADVTPPERRAKGMALIGAAFGLGFTFGPLIAYAGLEVFQAAHWAPGAVAAGLGGVLPPAR